jgi:hypothetical protein
MKTIKIALLVPFLALAMFACEPIPANEEPDREFAREISKAEATFDNIAQMAEILLKDAGVYKTEQFCAEITLDTAARQLTVDFGTGCTGIDGITRSGLFYINYIGKHQQPGSQLSITFVEYTEDGNQLNGTLAMHSFDRDANNHLFFTISVTDGLLVSSNGDSVGYEGVRTLTWVAGENTPNIVADDEYEVTGNAAGFNAEGESYTLEIKDALLYKQNCRQQGITWPAAGSLEITSSEFVGTLGIDYGTGTCDHSAVITWRGRNYQLNL